MVITTPANYVEDLRKAYVLADFAERRELIAKRTAELIPLCHNVEIEHVDVSLELRDDGVRIAARSVCTDKTGIEMEALTAVSVAALAIYDMCKAVDRGMRIGDIRLVEKTKETGSE